MTYLDWFTAHAAKHADLMKKLENLSDDEVIRYFRFENMAEKERDFCPLYSENTKCHDMPELNCYLCACPHFRFNDGGFSIVEGKTLFSICSIDSAEGERYIGEHTIHQNCAGCLIPHRESYVAKVFDRNWLAMMGKSPANGL